jgi:hypothetical protein
VTEENPENSAPIFQPGRISSLKTGHDSAQETEEIDPFPSSGIPDLELRAWKNPLALWYYFSGYVGKS